MLYTKESSKNIEYLNLSSKKKGVTWSMSIIISKMLKLKT
jgi:hypothetical protein